MVFAVHDAGGDRWMPPWSLDRMLVVRENLAVSLYELLSHGRVDVAQDLLDRLLSVEELISDVRPRTFPAMQARWTRREAGWLHRPGDPRYVEACQLCSGDAEPAKGQPGA